MTRTTSLGQYLDQARKISGFSMQQLATITHIPKTTIVRLTKDAVSAPRAEHLMSLATHLELPTKELFDRAGIAMPQQATSLSALLRSEYDLTGDELREAQSYIERIIRRHGVAAGTTRENEASNPERRES